MDIVKHAGQNSFILCLAAPVFLLYDLRDDGFDACYGHGIGPVCVPVFIINGPADKFLGACLKLLKNPVYGSDQSVDKVLENLHGQYLVDKIFPDQAVEQFHCLFPAVDDLLDQLVLR